MAKMLTINQMMGYVKKNCTTDMTLRKYVEWLDTQNDAIRESLCQIKTDMDFATEYGREESEMVSEYDLKFVEERFNLAKAIASHHNVSQETLCELVQVAFAWPVDVLMEIIKPVQEPYTLSLIYNKMDSNIFNWTQDEWEKLRDMIAAKDVSNAKWFNRLRYSQWY